LLAAQHRLIADFGLSLIIGAGLTAEQDLRMK